MEPPNTILSGEIRCCSLCLASKPTTDFSTKGVRDGKPRLDSHCRSCGAKRKRDARSKRHEIDKSISKIKVFGRQDEEIDLSIETMESEEFYAGLDFILEVICDRILEAKDGEISA